MPNKHHGHHGHHGPASTYPGGKAPHSSPTILTAARSSSAHKERNNSESPQCEVIEITSSLTINNVNKYTALARARRKIMFIARKTDQNQFALHCLQEHGRATPDGIMLKDNQIQVLTSSETSKLLQMAKNSKI